MYITYHYVHVIYDLSCVIYILGWKDRYYQQKLKISMKEENNKGTESQTMK